PFWFKMPFLVEPRVRQALRARDCPMSAAALPSGMSATAALPRGLYVRNTFLDCKSPWFDTLTFDERPQSDPTDDRVSSKWNSGSMAGTSTSEDASSLGNQGLGGPRLVTEGAAHQEMVQLEQPGGDRTSEKTRNQRRRAQRKLIRAVKAGIADTGDLPSGAPAASSSGSGMGGGTSCKLSL
ncbi:unnamed protein product, partial [Prorocentrum cordatum]